MTKKPWLVEGSPWKTESAFWVWVRGVLRKGWSKHPIKIEYIKRHRMRVPNPKPSKRFPEVWGMECECCKKLVVQSEIQIDHIGDSSSFTGLDDARSYIEHLFLIDYESIRPLCLECHKIVNVMQAQKLTFEEARIQKEIIRISKLPKQELLAYLEQEGYSGESVSNDKKRRACVELILNKGE